MESNVGESIYTVGHSNRDIDELLAVLGEVDIEVLVDIRTYPSSRRFPWFNEGNLEESLEEVGIGYEHLEALGGYREAPDAETPSIAGVPEKWRAYAAHVQSEEFEAGLERLAELAEAEGRVVYMCAERDPDRCHRRFVSDVLALRGWRVDHLLRPGERRRHEVRETATMRDDGRVTYPQAQGELPLSDDSS